MASGKYNGAKIADDLNNDGTDVTVYSDAFSTSDCSVWSVHLEWVEDTATFATAITLWASNKPEPGADDDTDWVQMTATHGWDGFAGGDPAGGNGKDLADVGISGAKWYRLKFVRSTGAGTIQAWLHRKSDN